MSKRTHSESLLSVEHLAYNSVPGKIDAKIYQRLLYQGIEKKSWVVRANLKELTTLHPGDEEFTLGCLGRLKHYNLIFTVCKSKCGWIFLIPALKDFVQEIADPFGKGTPGIPSQRQRNKKFNFRALRQRRKEV